MPSMRPSSRVGEHLRRNAPDVDARAAEAAVFHDGHVEIAERVVHDAVARTCADHDKVVVVHTGSVGGLMQDLLPGG
jgi:hypothetical protein